MVSTDPATDIVTVNADTEGGGSQHGHAIFIETFCQQTDQGNECTIDIFAGEGIQVSDSPEEPCEIGSAQSITLVECPSSTQGLLVSFGDGDDILHSYPALPTTVYGGGGDDALESGDGPDRLFGEAGSDELVGYGGRDTLAGGNGDDLLASLERDGADEFFGGEGNDLLSYACTCRDTAVTVSLDDQANDGTSSEGDNAHSDIENLEGTAFADRLGGSSHANRIYGLAGADIIKGWGGADRLVGAKGADEIRGLGGRDEFGGGKGADDLFGGRNADHIRGHAGRDELFGGGGDDVLDGGADRDVCRQGAGHGSASNCEG